MLRDPLEDAAQLDPRLVRARYLASRAAWLADGRRDVRAMGALDGWQTLSERDPDPAAEYHRQ